MNAQSHTKNPPVISYCILIGLIFSAGMIVGCFQSEAPESVTIAVIKGEPVYMDELDVLARIAVAKSGLVLESDEGQARYKEIAPNLYETLVNIYVLKYTAEEEIEAPSPDELEIEFARYKDTLVKEGSYERFMEYHKLTEEKLKESIVDHLMVKNLQEKVLSEFDYEPDEREISDTFFQNHAKFRYPARMRASHIFTTAKIEDGKEKRKQARQRIEQLLKMIGNEPAKTFSALAKQNSENQATAPNGGDLGFFARDDPRLIEPIKKAAFALGEGKISGVIETDYGYHILWATDHEQSLDEAHDQIKAEMIQNYKSKKFDEWLQEKEESLEIKLLFDPETFTVLPLEKPEAKKANAE